MSDTITETEDVAELMHKFSISVEVALYDSDSNKKAIHWVARIEPKPTDNDPNPAWVFGEGATVHEAIRAVLAQQQEL